MVILSSQTVCLYEMSESMPKKKSEKSTKQKVTKKNVPKQNTSKTRRPEVKGPVKSYIQRIYDVTGINPTKIVKRKDGKLEAKNIELVRKLVKRKFSHLDTSGINKHIKAIYDEQYQNPSISSFTRSLDPFGSSISKDVASLIEKFNKNIPFVKPKAIESKKKNDKDDINFDMYSGIKNDARRYAVDIVNDMFKGISGESSEKMKTDIINGIHRIKFNEDPNESKEDAEKRYKGYVLDVVNNVADDSLDDLKQKLIDRINNDDFDVDDDPIENYREVLEYRIERMFSDALTSELKNDLTSIKSYIDNDKNGEYDPGTLDNIYFKLQHLTDNLELKTIDGIIVDKGLRQLYHDIYPKIDFYLFKGYNTNDGTRLRNLDNLYYKYLDKLNDIAFPDSNTDDVEIELFKDTNKPIYSKGGVIDKIIEEATTNDVRDIGQKTRTRWISTIIAKGLDGVPNVTVDTIRNIAKSILEKNKGDAEWHGANTLALKTNDKLKLRRRARTYGSMNDLAHSEYRPRSEITFPVQHYNDDLFNYGFSIGHNTMDSNKLNDDELRKSMNKALDTDFVNEVMKEYTYDNGISEISNATSRFGLNVLDSMDTFYSNKLKESIDKALNPDFLREIMGVEKGDKSEEEINEEEAIVNNVIEMLEQSPKNNEEKQVELSESSESSTIESINEEEEEYPEEEQHEEEHRDEEDLEEEHPEEEHGDDKNTSNEMSEDIAKELSPAIVAANEILSEIIARATQPQTPQKAIDIAQVAYDTPNEDSDQFSEYDLDDSFSIQNVPKNSSVIVSPQGGEPGVIAEREIGTQSQSPDNSDPGYQNQLKQAMTSLIAELRYSQSQSDTNNIFNGMASVLRELPNGVDDEVANRLSQAVGPNGTKLFESKEEAARFLAMLRNLMGGNLSTLRGSGNSDQKHAIRLNIDNKVVSNMPRKPFIVDTHPIPYQY